MNGKFSHLKSKSVVMTGCSTGIGRSIAKLFVREGATVYAIGRNEGALRSLQREASQRKQLRVCLADVRRPRDVELAVNRILGSCKSIDALINVAGVWHDKERAFFGPELDKIDDNEILEVLGASVYGALFLTKRVLATMKRERRGKIVFVGCGFEGPHEATGWLHYYTANKAVEAMSEGLAAECRPHNIQVNCIAPWYVATDALKRFFPERVRSALSPDEIARFAALLTSPEADHLSGQVSSLRSNEEGLAPH